MIPKKAWFMWCSDNQMPWLRMLSVETFAIQNPDWQVEIVQLKRDPFFKHAAQQADMLRYEILSSCGGVCFDTDIVFIKPFPDEYLDCDVLVTLEPKMRFYNIATLGGSPDNAFWRKASDAAAKRYEDAPYNRHEYQLLGVCIMNRTFDPTPGERVPVDQMEQILSDKHDLKVVSLPERFVTPFEWFEVYRLYNNTPADLPDETVGVHWFGGHMESRQYCSRMTADTYHLHPCFLTNVISGAIGDPGQGREVLESKA